MVAASVRMSEFCPLFFLPTLCFPTWFLPLPFVAPLPVNLGPFVLLFVTKLFLPQSSLTGHLAGIVIGFPLAWGLLDWVTPPVLGAALLLCYVHLEDLWVWKLPGYTRSRQSVGEDTLNHDNESDASPASNIFRLFVNDNALASFVPNQDLKAYGYLRVVTFILTLWTLMGLPFSLIHLQSFHSSPFDMSVLLLPGFWLQMFPHMTLLGMNSKLSS